MSRIAIGNCSPRLDSTYNKTAAAELTKKKKNYPSKKGKRLANVLKFTSSNDKS